MNKIEKITCNIKRRDADREKDTLLLFNLSLEKSV